MSQDLLKILEIKCEDCKDVLKIKCTEKEYEVYLSNLLSPEEWSENIRNSWNSVGWALEPYTLCNPCYLNYTLTAIEV